MITITQNGTKVKVTLDPNIDGRVMILNWECNGDWYAHLLARKLNETLASKVESARREAYEQGYKDGKGKKAKLNWFSTKL